MRGRYYREGKNWIVKFTLVWKEKKEKRSEEKTQEVPNPVKTQHWILIPPDKGFFEVEFELDSKGQIIWKTLKSVEKMEEISLALSLPKPFTEFNKQFFGLAPELQQAILFAIKFRSSVRIEDVALLLRAVQQDFPLAFKQSKDFKQSLCRLVARPGPEEQPGRLAIFQQIGSQRLLNEFQLMEAKFVPLTIMIHGSSVAGLRAKDKGKGWQFNSDSDIDVTIVDLTRFVWAQALGIVTYDNADTIELTDTHLHLLKLYRFAEAFRKTVKARQVNFGVYVDVETARKHEGFTLVCTFNEHLSDFAIERIYNPELNAKGISQKDLKGIPHRLRDLFEIDEIPVIEEWVTSSDLEKLRAQGQLKLPSQGNHIFNDVPDTLLVLSRSIDSLFELSVKRSFVTSYTGILQECAAHLNQISRVVSIAEREHGKSAIAILKGFEVPSDKTNELLYGNAITYFRNASILFCDVGSRIRCSPRQLADIAPIVKKSFANLLDSAVDNTLLANLIAFRSGSSIHKYAIDRAKEYRGVLRREVNRFFKKSLDDLMIIQAIMLVKARIAELDIPVEKIPPDEFVPLFEYLTPEQAWIVSKNLGI